ncbi:allophanate hydrolase subunit 1 [Fertoebacter nigrum]|uniref:Allophanate hydrolase subunit 1 n=1 Tax=Fertoeibacter niger TaxID=2656921 RepID=A0A8X8KQ64_9RHOB|nr:allophanate hydrolase subunit 1 [Fertoeibacter niger]NUB45621.1 allophanate hydrolase subunit 1 [Fertoeibacter niger]
MPGFPRFRPVADHALLVEFADVSSETAHAAVLRLDRALAAHPFAGFAEAVPATVSLLVDFDPVVTDHAAACAALRALLAQPAAPGAEQQHHQVPVCYDGDCAADLAEVARLTGHSPDAVIAAHLAAEYTVAMYGFAPGYAYLAGGPPALHLPRKPAALRGIAAGSVIIAGAQCLITTLTMPTGWWIIGRSPTRVLTAEPARPFLFAVGDRVAFRRIGQAELGPALAARTGKGAAA